MRIKAPLNNLKMLQITILSILLIGSITGLVISLKEIIKNDREIRQKNR